MTQRAIDIQIRGDHRRMMRDVNTVLMNMERRAAVTKVREINNSEMRPLSQELRRRMPPVNPKTKRYKRKKRQPYGHLKRNVRIQTLRKNRSGKFVGIHTDAFHYNFLEFGTITRRTKQGANRGRIRGRWGSGGGFNAVGDTRAWAEKRMLQILPRMPEKYFNEIWDPATEDLRRRYSFRIIYRMNRP